MIYQKKARTRTVSEIPHVYVKEAIDSLYGRHEPVATAPDRTLLEQWNKAPNLVHGDFEQGRRAPSAGVLCVPMSPGCKRRSRAENRKTA